jgi:hypothetical protein
MDGVTLTNIGNEGKRSSAQKDNQSLISNVKFKCCRQSSGYKDPHLVRKVKVSSVEFAIIRILCKVTVRVGVSTDSENNMNH